MERATPSGMNRREFWSNSASSAMLMVAAIPGANSPSDSWDPEGQIQRRDQIYRLHGSSVGPLFDEHGSWIGASAEPGGRERLWNCLSLLKNRGMQEKANAILTTTFAQRSRFAPFSHFEFVTSVQLLVRDTGELSKSNKGLLLGVVNEGILREEPLRFLGYNDNFPAMENLVATVGGMIVDKASARQRGLDGMYRLMELLSRRGVLSEYTSSTYSPVTMLCYADIASYADRREERDLALEIERRVWMDIAAHFHAPTNILAGPHSRAYAVDSVGHPHQIHMTLYQAFGSRLWMNPMRFLFPPVEKQVIHHDGDVSFMQVSAVWMASGIYHPTAETERLLFQKRLPCRVSTTAEAGAWVQPIMRRHARSGGQPVKVDSDFEYPAGEVVTTTYLTDAYALGSATSAFLDGNQTDVFFVNFRRTEQPDSLAGVSTIFSRFCVDDDLPGEPWTDPRAPGKEMTRSLLGESGVARAVQKDRTAIVAYQSKQQFTGEYKALRLTIIVPVFYRDLNAILVAGRRVSLPYESAVAETVYLQDDFLYTAFRPLGITNHGRRNALRIERNNGYLAIHFINYEGDWREFSRAELARTLNGFVAEISSPSEWSSFEQFRISAESALLQDETIADQRLISYSRQGVQLGLAYSILSGGLKYASVDGKELARVPFQVSEAASQSGH